MLFMLNTVRNVTSYHGFPNQG